MKLTLRLLLLAPVIGQAGCVSTPSGFEWVMIAFVALLLFGGAKLPGLMRSMGAGVHEFKKGLKEGEKEEAAEEKASKELKSGKE